MSNQIDSIKINWLNPPQNCCFLFNKGWEPGWVIGQIKLPFTEFGRRYLVRDFTGKTYWCKNVVYEKEHPNFVDWKTLDWTRINRLESLK